MTRTRRTLQKLSRLESRPAEIPMSLEAAFAEIEQLDARHPEARGTNYGAIIHPQGHADAPRMSQGGR
jgi:hypothetical protein